MHASGGAVISHLDITERKLAEESLRDSEEKFRTLAENLPDTIHVFDLEKLEVQYTNNSTFMGYTPEQLGDNNFLKRIVHSDDWDKLESGMQHISRNVVPEDIEFRMKAASGQWEWIQKKMTPFQIKNERVTKILNVDTIISERKWTEEIIRESEEKFRNIVEQSSDAIILTDTVGDIIEWNTAAENIFDLRKDEVLGKPIWDVQYIVAPEEQKTEANYQRLRKKIVQFFETQSAEWAGKMTDQPILREDGSKRIVQTTMFPIKIEDGIMAGFIVRDITESKLAEAELREQEQELSLITESTIDTIFMLDAQGVILYLSPSVIDLQGYTPEEMIGRNFQEFVLPQELPKYINGMQEVFDKKKVVNLEVLTRRKNGDLVPTEINGRLSYRQGEPVGVGSIRDITERKKAEQELEKLIGKLAESNKRLKMSNEEL